MQSVSRQKPKMWGPSIVGFCSCHYGYDSGREGDMPLICFSPRKSGSVVYGMQSADKSLSRKLGKHQLSGSCLHIKKLSDVDDPLSSRRSSPLPWLKCARSIRFNHSS